VRKATISFAMSVVSLSVYPHETTRLPLDGFSWNLVFDYFRNSVPKKNKLQVTKITGTLRPMYTVDNISLKWELSRDKTVQKIKTYYVQ
jgi:hypothetical protein